MKTLLYIGPAHGHATFILKHLREAGFTTFHLAPEGSNLDGEGAHVDYLEQTAWQEAVRDLEPHSLLLDPAWCELGEFLETGAEEWRQAIAVNIEASTYALQAVAARMVDRSAEGNIVTLLHSAGLKPFHSLSAYGTSLAAIETLLRMLAIELAPTGIAVNSVAPGFTEGGPLKLTGKALRVLEEDNPRGRLVDQLEVARCCRMLLELEGSGLTGQVIRLDGGQLLTRGRPGAAPSVE